MAITTQANRLSNAQAVLLQMFERDLPENDLLEVRDILTKHFAKKARMEADKAIKNQTLSLANIEKASKELAESRTAYLKKLRNEGRPKVKQGTFKGIVFMSDTLFDEDLK